MKSAKFLLTLLVLGTIGLLWLGFSVYIDGHYVRPVIEFEGDAQTEKLVYQPGELVRAKVSFCKYRAFESVIQWHLVDGYLKVFPARTSAVAPGCYTDLVIDIEEIPKDQVPDSDLHFEQILQYRLNSWNTVAVPLRTNNFRVARANSGTPLIVPPEGPPETPSPPPVPDDPPDMGVLSPLGAAYVTGTYSKYCYHLGTEHGNIKYKSYYRSLEDCGKPLAN